VARFFRPRFIYRHPAAILLPVIQPANRLTRGIVIRHFDEAKPLTATSVTILDNFRTTNRAVFREQLLELRSVDAVA
jgi:hypothetical protein